MIFNINTHHFSCVIFYGTYLQNCLIYLLVSALCCRTIPCGNFAKSVRHVVLTFWGDSVTMYQQCRRVIKCSRQAVWLSQHLFARLHSFLPLRVAIKWLTFSIPHQITNHSKVPQTAICLRSNMFGSRSLSTMVYAKLFFTRVLELF